MTVTRSKRRKSIETFLNLGQRKVSTMNFSKVVTLPKAFTDNCLDENMMVQVSMTGDRCLILTPVRNQKQKKGGDKA